jgi:hypothetical protein
METNYIVLAYLIYLPVALLMTFLVARALFKNAIIFMNDIFHGKEEIANATNKLFEIGFYLMNIGTALFILQINEVGSIQELIEKLSLKIGGFSIYLGFMLFANLYLFFRGRKKSKTNAF